MPPKNRSLSGEIEALLLSKAAPEEVENLNKLQIKNKSPTKLTVIIAALYKKAAGGDLSAIKELLCRLDPEKSEEKGVVIIDDIKKADK